MKTIIPSRRLLAIASVAIATPVLAQTQTQNSQAPAVRTIPGLDNFSLPPSGQQTAPQPIAPRPTPTPDLPPTPALGPTQPRAAGRPLAPVSVVTTPTPQTVPRLAPPNTPPAAAPAPQPGPTVAASTPAPSPFPSPMPTATPMMPITPAVAGSGRRAWWLVPSGLALFLLAVLGVILSRRRAKDDGDAFPDLESLAIEPALKNPPPTAPLREASQARAGPARLAAIVFELHPRRAGTNLTSAAVDYAVVVRNTGTAAARGVAVDLRLLSAGARQDDELRAIAAAPIDRPVVAPFDLPPGGSVDLTGMAMLPRDTLGVMTVEGRALFVPVIALTASYAHDGGTGRAAAAWMIGIDRGAGAKMAPFRLDGPPRMHASVVAVAYPVPGGA